MDFISYKEKPLVRCKNEIYYGDMTESHVVKFTIVSENANGDPDKIKVQLQCLKLWTLALFGLNVH